MIQGYCKLITQNKKWHTWVLVLCTGIAFILHAAVTNKIVPTESHVQRARQENGGGGVCNP